MQQVDSVAVVLRESRFVTGPDQVRLLLPGLDRALPGLGRLEYLDGTPRSALGWALHPSGVLQRELLRFIVTAVGRAQSGDAPDLDDLTVEGLRGEPYVIALATLLSRCGAHGPRAGLDAPLWLYLSAFVARLLARDEGLLRDLGARLPEDVHKARKYLDELLRLKGSNPGRHAAVKTRALRALLARHDVALNLAAETTGLVTDGTLHRLMVESRLVWTEQPDGLYSFFDLREAFAVRSRRLELERFLELQGFVRACVDEAWRKRAAGGLTGPEGWLLDQYVSEALLERASRLELAGLTDSQEDDYPARVGVVASLQPELARYVLHHADRFTPSRAAAKRYGLGKELLRQVQSEGVSAAAAAYTEVVQDVLRWDLLNTARGFVRVVTRSGDDWREAGRRLRRSSPVIDLEDPGTLLSRRRHGSFVAWRITGFEEELRGQLAAPGEDLLSGEDFSALCLGRILTARSALVGGGRSDGFDRGLGLDVFPRALDALRHAVALARAVSAHREVRIAPGGAVAANPFAHGLRIGVSAGEAFDVTVPADDGSRTRAAGPAVDEAASLVRELEGVALDGRVAVDEYDPLEVFHATVTGGRLVNRGIVSNERAFLETLASVRLDELTHAAEDRDAVIAGRAVEFKSYKFELVWDDPVLKSVVFVRRIGEPFALSGAEQPVFEYLAMSIAEFVSFCDAAAKAARAQPLVRPGPARRHAPERPSASRPPSDRSAPPRPPAPQLPDLAIPDKESFFVGSGASRSQELLGDRLGLSFDEAPEPAQADDLFSSLFGEDSGSAWPPEQAWLNDPFVADGAPDIEADPADSGGLFGPGAFDFGLLEEAPPVEPPAPRPARRQSPPSATAPAAPRPASLIGRLDRDFLARLDAVAPSAPPAPRPSQPPLRPPRPETVRAVRPDFGAVFRDYVVFEISGDPKRQVAIGRRYKDVLFDLHRFDSDSADRDAALDAFMRSKVRSNFVPKSLSYDEVPAGAGPIEALSVALLEASFDRVTR